MSTPPKARHHLVEGGAHAGRIGDIACDRQRLAADVFAAFPPRRDRGRGWRLPRLAWPCALAVAAPMPEPPPVINATWRASDFSFDLPSLACSSDQYSTSNMSNSLMRLVFADRFGVGDHRDRVLGDVGGDGGVLGARRRRRTGRRPAPGSRAAGDRVPSSSARALRCCARNRRDSARRKPSTAACTSFVHSSSLPASGAGTISGQFLVRMVWSGVTTPTWL